MNIRQLALICGTLSTLFSSCTVCTRSAVADYGRSAEAILLPLENPVLSKVGEDWFMHGQKATVERSNLPWVDPECLAPEKRHTERYKLTEGDFSPTYAKIPEKLAESICKGKYTHSDAISFINRSWVDTLPEGEVREMHTKAKAPDFFRQMDSHRLLKSEQGSTYLLAHIGEMTADFNALFIYPLAGLSAIFVDTPASFFHSPPSGQIQQAEAEEVE